MLDDNSSVARVDKISRWSPVWIIPLLTLLIGGWILFYHYSHQGPLVILVTDNAEGIEAGKTLIKNRSIDVGVVESTELTADLKHVEIRARLHDGMQKLLSANSMFWMVKPQVGLEGITGLGTLLSGAYIELKPGSKGSQLKSYTLLNAPPLAPSDAKGLRVILDSKKAGQLTPGNPVLFRGLRVGTVETSQFDTEKLIMSYQLFISYPYDRLVTTNVRFRKNSGIAVDLSASGMRVEMGSLTTLLGGGVSFDVPDGRELGQPVNRITTYKLYEDQRSINDSLYTQHVDFLMFFTDSVRGLESGAPVEFRGIRLGTVAQVPFFLPDLNQDFHNHYRVPVLIHIEPERFISGMGENFDVDKRLQLGKKRGLRGALKTGSFLSGSLYVDLDYYENIEPYTGPEKVAGYKIIPTTNSGLNQIQQKLVAILDKINNLPLNPLLSEATVTLKESQLTMAQVQKSLTHINEFISSPAMKTLPDTLQESLIELNRSMKGIQPGSPLYIKLVRDMQRLDLVLRELQPVLNTLNGKSNALIFEASAADDPNPVRARK